MIRLFFLLKFLILFFGKAFAQDSTIVIVPQPTNIYIEQGKDKQIINCDFLVSNDSEDTLSLDKLSVSVFDKENNLLHTRFLDNNGTAPSIYLLPKRIWNGKSNHLLFNPFSEFQLISLIHKLTFEWTFTNTQRKSIVINNDIFPKAYKQNYPLHFPVKGRVMVYDAHDYTSHHRRFDYNFTPIKQLGLITNFMRYAYDFVIVDDQNRQFKNKGETDADYYSFSSPVYAVADGKIIYAANNHKDDKNFDIPKLIDNPLELYGNCIALQHKDSSVSIYGHLKANSLKVKVGDVVHAKQELAQIGVSGSSFFPHLHFEVRTSIGNQAEGLPSNFENIFLVDGKQKIKLEKGLVETGNIIEAK